MALSGSQKAYLQARSNIARSGATRSNYYLFTTVITIDNGGVPVDITAHVAYNGWSVSMNINDEVDTATLRLLPSLPFVPQTRSQVKIGFGSADNVQFAGLVMTVQRTRKPGPDPRFWYDLTCVDWLTIFDAHLVLANYPAQSATTTILDLVARFTNGHFTTEGVAAGMPSVDAMQIINERPSTILRRLTNLVGGGFYIDAARRLRAWSAAIPSPIQESTPQALTDDLATLKTFRMTEDASQQRTRVIVEGQRTSTRLGIPAPFQTSVHIPVEDVAAVHDFSGHPERYTRVGTQYYLATQLFNPTLDASRNPPGTKVTFDAAIGATQLYVESNAAFPEGGWCQVDDQILNFSKQALTDRLMLPGTGLYGALAAPVAVGAQVVVLGSFFGEPMDRANLPADPYIWVKRVPWRAQPVDMPVVLVVMKQDQTTAAALATRENSDGYYEHLVQDGRFASEGATARAVAELANFAPPLVTYEWETDDLNAEPGRMQHIAFVEGTPVTADVRITNVEVTPVVSRQPPRRSVRATLVQPASVMDIWIEETR